MMRIWPKKIDVIIVAAIGTLCLGFLIAMHWDLSRSDLVLIASMFLAYMLILAIRACQWASVDSRKLKYHVLGIIPVEIYWYEVAQIGIVRFPNRGSTSLMGEMFAIVLKPCKKYEEGHKELHHLHPSPKWRHPFLVKNIYCDTEKYKGIIEEYSRKKVSFERIYY